MIVVISFKDEKGRDGEIKGVDELEGSPDGTT